MMRNNSNRRIRTRPLFNSLQQQTSSAVTRGPIIRTGPLKFAIVLMCAIPIVLLSITERKALKMRQQDPLIPGSAAEARWRNPNHTVSNHRTAARALQVLQPAYKSGAKSGSSNNSSTSNGGRIRCDVHSVRTRADEAASDLIFLELDSQIMVVIVLQDTQQWVVSKQAAYAIPGSVFLTPVTGSFSTSEAPFAAAQRITRQLLEMKPGGSSKATIGFDEHDVIRDEHNVPDGTVPEAQKEQWTFLGRYRNLADAGAGFTYTYLFRATSDKVSISVPKRTCEALQLGDDACPVLLSKKDVRQALLNGDFQEIRGAATIGLALQHSE